MKPVLDNVDANTLVSVIIPAFNAQDTIARCLDSVRRQTYENLEIIIIDDGSSDATGMICREYEAHDKRIHVIFQENRGVSSARNVAISLFQGEYVTFVDADDWIQEDMISSFVFAAQKYGVNLVTSVASDRNRDGTESAYQAPLPKNDLVVNIETEFSFQEAYAHGVVWGNLFHRNIIEGIHFAPDLYVGEDSLFFAQAVRRCEKLVFLSHRYYNYVINDQSALHGNFNEQKFTEVIAWKRISELFKENQRLNASACLAYSLRCAEIMTKIYCAEGMKHAGITQLNLELRRLKPYWNSAALGWKKKCKLIMLTIMPQMYLRMRKL